LKFYRLAAGESSYGRRGQRFWQKQENVPANTLPEQMDQKPNDTQSESKILRFIYVKICLVYLGIIINSEPALIPSPRYCRSAPVMTADLNTILTAILNWLNLVQVE
jgi:hypothetical protein